MRGGHRENYAKKQNFDKVVRVATATSTWKGITAQAVPSHLHICIHHCKSVNSPNGQLLAVSFLDDTTETNNKTS